MEQKEILEYGIKFLMIKIWEIIITMKRLLKEGGKKMWYLLKKRFDVIVLWIMSLLMFLKMAATL